MLGLCLIHRNFFEKATTEYAANPLESPFGTSVMASYRSAYSTIAVYAWMFERHPSSMCRIWNHAMAITSVAMTLGLLAIRCPGLALAESAIGQIDLAAKIVRTVNTTFQNEDAEVRVPEGHKEVDGSDTMTVRHAYSTDRVSSRT
jgi:hypothetical protein